MSLNINAKQTVYLMTELEKGDKMRGDKVIGILNSVLKLPLVSTKVLRGNKIILWSYIKLY